MVDEKIVYTIKEVIALEDKGWVEKDHKNIIAYIMTRKTVKEAIKDTNYNREILDDAQAVKYIPPENEEEMQELYDEGWDFHKGYAKVVVMKLLKGKQNKEKEGGDK